MFCSGFESTTIGQIDAETAGHSKCALSKLSYSNSKNPDDRFPDIVFIELC